MKVKVKTELKGMDGKVIHKDEAKKEVLTIGDVLIVCLQTALKGDDEDSGEQRIKKFNIMKELHSNNKEIEMDSSEITLMKERILKIYPNPIIYGRMCEAFGDSK